VHCINAAMPVLCGAAGFIIALFAFAVLCLC
jgi:hypothetical protein